MLKCLCMVTKIQDIISLSLSLCMHTCARVCVCVLGGMVVVVCLPSPLVTIYNGWYVGFSNRKLYLAIYLTFLPLYAVWPWVSPVLLTSCFHVLFL